MASDDEIDYLADNIEYDDDEDIDADDADDDDDEDEEDDEDDKDLLSENHSSDIHIPISKKKSTLKKIKNPSMCTINSVLGRSNKSINKKIVPNDERITSNVLKQSEYGKLLSVISTMVANGSIAAPPNIQSIDPITIAKKIIDDRKVPFLFQRIVSPSDEVDIEIEFWDPNTMIIPKYTE